MWFLLYSIIRVGKRFELVNEKIGDVHPFNILVNDEGMIKMISQYSLPGEMTNFERVLEDRNAKVFLGMLLFNAAPE